KPIRSHGAGWLLLAHYLGTLDDHAGALEAARRATELAPRDSCAWERRWTEADHLGLAEEAATALARVTELEGGPPSWSRNPLSRFLGQGAPGAVRRLRRRVEGEAFTRTLRSEREICEEARARIRIDPALVPAGLRDLVPLARRWGIGDDACRGYLGRRATREERRELRAIRDRVEEIVDWIKSFPERGMSDEAAA